MPKQTLPLMPKATAAWLINETGLTFEQIADFCGLHRLEVQAMADGDAGQGIMGLDPVLGGQLTAESIKECEADAEKRLKLVENDEPLSTAKRSGGPRYTPVTKRADKPDGVSWLLKNYPQLQDAQVANLIGTTRETLQKIKDRSHWNAMNIRPRNPVLLGLCSQADLDAAIAKADRAMARAEKKAAQEARLAAGETLPPEDLGAQETNAAHDDLAHQDDLMTSDADKQDGSETEEATTAFDADAEGDAA